MLEMPNDLELTLPRITTVGNKSINIENYMGILEYSDKKIRIQAKGNEIRIAGEDLLIKFVTRDEISINGAIYSIEYWN